MQNLRKFVDSFPSPEHFESYMAVRYSRKNDIESFDDFITQDLKQTPEKMRPFTWEIMTQINWRYRGDILKPYFYIKLSSKNLFVNDENRQIFFPREEERELFNKIFYPLEEKDKSTGLYDFLYHMS